MLQLKDICKSYRTADFTQVALDNVSVAFRDNEFVAILGPSGSGKTTLLNIIGGLDHYDSGDLIIDSVSTKRYNDHDWDTYRNNRVGFVFQSYNLIPHQSILENVELALTLSGVPAAERRRRAIHELERVGLGDHLHKRPSQLSGGQMQRVAIARALINDPEILLADEPTGALDSKTSVQIMNLLQEIARDRLVVMVTHNPELAEEYATRIVTLTDGTLRADTDPFAPTPEQMRLSQKIVRRTSMSPLTALSLSFRNLMTKKGRTLMTAFAGSIGIIGIAAILALANGVNNYIKTVEEETLSEYPLEITSTGFDITSMLVGMGVETEGDTPADDSPAAEEKALNDEGDGAHELRVAEMMTSMFGSVGSNDLASLKKFLDKNGDGIDDYVNAIEYSYSIQPQIFLPNTEKLRQVNPDSSLSLLGLGAGSSNNLLSATMSTNVFYEMPRNGSLYEEQYDVLAGRWPQNYNEVVVVTTPMGSISDFMLYTLGLRDSAELDAMVRQFAAEEDVDIPENIAPVSYDDVLAVRFKLVNASDFYAYDEEYDVWVNKADDDAYMAKLVEDGEEIAVVGIVKPKPEATATMLSAGVNYPSSLVDHVIEAAAESRIVKDQLADPAVDVFTGEPFDDEAASPRDAFDMTSMFTVDEDVLRTALQIDEDALALDMDNFDIDPSALSFDASKLAAMDLSSLNINPSVDLSGIDMGDMDLSGMDLSGVSMDLSNLDLSDMQLDLSDMDMTMPEISMTDAVDTAAMAKAMGEVMSGFATWLPGQLKDHPEYMTDMQAAMNAYMAQPEVQQQMAEAMAGAIDTSKIEQQISSAMAAQQEALKQKLQEQLAAQIQQAVVPAIEKQMKEKLVPEIQKQVATQVSKQIQQKLLPQIQAKISSSLQKSLTSSLQPAIEKYLQTAMTQVASEMGTAMETQVKAAMEKSLGDLSSKMGDALSVDPDVFASAFQTTMNEEDLTELLTSMFTAEDASYDGNLRKLGYAKESDPAEIKIYPKDFDAKAEVIRILDDYNARMEASGKEDQVITYTDFVGALMTSVTDIINMISYVLIAFVAISLIVSSIMIGIITYISVLERKKEIGILRAIGASKGDISMVFNAETVIVGFAAGCIGIGLTALLCLPANYIVYTLFDVPNVALLPPVAAVILVGISVALTFIAGLFPSSAAAREDPVEALRSE